MGAHQKIDRISRRHLQRLTPHNAFPKIRTILHFEGGNGPDAIKRKSPAKNEPWHYFQPFDEADTKLLTLIEEHYSTLVKALSNKDDIRAGFEAAWIAHAVVDGLTPAHHYPYEEKLVELRSGRGLESRNTLTKKMLFPGNSLRNTASNNWKFWGPRGLFTTHFSFEWGVATLIMPMKLRRAMPTADKMAEFEAMPLSVWFRRVAQDIARLELYDAFYQTGWTIPLARRIRRQLAPVLVQAVTLVWYGAQREAQKTKGR